MRHCESQRTLLFLNSALELSLMYTRKPYVAERLRDDVVKFDYRCELICRDLVFEDITDSFRSHFRTAYLLLPVVVSSFICACDGVTLSQWFSAVGCFI